MCCREFELVESFDGSLLYHGLRFIRVAGPAAGNPIILVTLGDIFEPEHEGVWNILQVFNYSTRWGFDVFYLTSPIK